MEPLTTFPTRRQCGRPGVSNGLLCRQPPPGLGRIALPVIMQADLSFERQLANLKHESTAIAYYVYAENTIEHAASQSKKLLSRLNQTPTFWLTTSSALQASAYIAIARVFDEKSSRYNVFALLDAMEHEFSIFGREGLAQRKIDGQASPPWLSEYLDKAYYPTKSDVDRLRRYVDAYNRLNQRALLPARHTYLAHRSVLDSHNVQALFGRGTVKQLWRIATFLLRLENALWELLHNGRRPILRPAPYAIQGLFESSNSHSSSPHVRIVHETRLLMEMLEK